ncbi:MAG: hypothetical protein LBU27_03535 [Candidatus Peribacteria bacterium]|jgi:hypothetical protein|nr:hypothetical protein [Candidatus Peribacteria bacterium]
MQNGGVRNDGTNYFIAGYRLPMDNIQRKSDYLYFVINDKLYEASNRNFAGIENGKIIVKRMLDIDEDRDTWKASFTLETCEIDL